VKVTLRDPPPFASLRSASGAEVVWSREEDLATAELEIGWGDYLVLE
jgi:hypothetical protein